MRPSEADRTPVRRNGVGPEGRFPRPGVRAKVAKMSRPKGLAAVLGRRVRRGRFLLGATLGPLLEHHDMVLGTRLQNEVDLVDGPLHVVSDRAELVDRRAVDGEQVGLDLVGLGPGLPEDAVGLLARLLDDLLGLAAGLGVGALRLLQDPLGLAARLRERPLDSVRALTWSFSTSASKFRMRSARRPAIASYGSCLVESQVSSATSRSLAIRSRSSSRSRILVSRLSTRSRACFTKVSTCAGSYPRTVVKAGRRSHAGLEDGSLVRHRSSPRFRRLVRPGTLPHARPGALVRVL